ncbi:hypothetical protein [Catenuloplanes japonicus]|uniref:hypothetical protein n=1 Tax=Catenuloplanes japonicus TaxID=33876 RepID=UPI000B1F30EA|nr:hypothetical protein [Catenuloplanes japonicus]
MNNLPLGLRIFAAGAIMAAGSVLTMVLLGMGLVAIFSGSTPLLILSLGGALLGLVGSAVAWFRLLPAVRWLGVVFAAGALPLGWLVFAGVLAG